jgi:hypothetical protein
MMPDEIKKSEPVKMNEIYQIFDYNLNQNSLGKILLQLFSKFCKIIVTKFHNYQVYGKSALQSWAFATCY